MRNPLAWLLQSITDQKYSSIKEVLILDDASTDHTESTVEQFIEPFKKLNIEYRYVKNTLRTSLSSLRNQLIDMVSSEFVLFTDDDCIFSPYYVWAAQYLIDELTKLDLKTAAVTLPCYYRTPIPTNAVSIKDIGIFDTTNCKFSTNFHSVPIEYLNQPVYFKKTSILNPIKVSFLNGTGMVRTDVIKDIRFRTLINFPWNYAEWLEIGYEITNKGNSIYHCADPRFFSVHFKYGAIGNYQIPEHIKQKHLGNNPFTFQELVNFSSFNGSDTGERVSPEVYYLTEIGSLFSFFYRVNPEAAIAWAKKTYTEFVIDGKVYNKIMAESGLNKENRKGVWQSSIMLALHEEIISQQRDVDDTNR